MPTRRAATQEDIGRFKNDLLVSEDELRQLLDEPEAVVQVEESSFSDPGPDYTALTINGRQVGYRRGY